LTEPLFKLHEPEAGHFGPPSRAPVEFYKQEFEHSPVATSFPNRARFIGQLDEVVEYYVAHAQLLTLQSHSLVHGELHPSRIIVTDDGSLCFVNWEFAKDGDYCYDLAAVGLTPFGLLAGADTRHFSALLTLYQDVFSDTTIRERLRFYMAERCLSYIGHLCKSEENAEPVRSWFSILASALQSPMA